MIEQVTRAKGTWDELKGVFKIGLNHLEHPIRPGPWRPAMVELSDDLTRTEAKWSSNWLQFAARRASTSGQFANRISASQDQDMVRLLLAHGAE